MTTEPPKKGRFWRRCRIAFRRLRIAILLLILGLLCCLIYLNQVGLPGFLKRPLLARLEARGIDLEFTRLRWRWYHGIVAENVRFGRADQPFSPVMSLKEAQVRINHRALLKLQVQVDSLVLRRGQLIWPVAGTNEPFRQLLIDNIESELRFLPDDRWELDNFEARFAGARFSVSGALTNASAVRHWEWFRPAAPTPRHELQHRLQSLADVLQELHFASPPKFILDLRGDALDLQSFFIRFRVDAPDAQSPWGSFQNGQLSVLLYPASSTAHAYADIKLNALSAQTRWAATTNVLLDLRLWSADAGATNVEAALDTTAEQVATPWGRGTNMRFSAQWRHARTNAIPISGRGELQIDDVHLPLGEATTVRLQCTMLAPTVTSAGDESWGWWTNLAPHRLEWEARITGLKSTNAVAEELVCAGDWNAPLLTVRNISGALYEGTLNGGAALDVGTRELSFRGAANLDGHRLEPLLTSGGRRWLSQFSWEKPPLVQAEGSMILPAWTNRQPDWRGEVRPTLRLDGSFQIATGAFRGVSFTSARSRFTYTNLFWQLPDLEVIRPEGRADVVHYSSDATRSFYFRIRSTIDPGAARPLLDPAQQRTLDLAVFTQPPVVSAEVWGRWGALERIGVKGQFAATNFTFRGEPLDYLNSAAEFTNLMIRLTEPRAGRGTQQLSAATVTVDVRANKVYVTNGFSTMDPMSVARAISRPVIRAIAPYEFAQPPSVRVQGIIPITDVREANLQFQVEGGPLHWWKFNMPYVSGKVDWVGERVTIRDIHAQFYEGTAVGNAELDFRPPRGANVRFDMVATDASCHALMNDLSSRTNRVEGLLTVRLNITQANTEDWRAVQGRGRVHLRDGLIWDIPVFGIFSPVLDAIVPGLGNSRARQGSATFGITNGVASSEDLEIHTSGARLQYAGTVALDGRVDARVEAELFRDTWVVGRLLSLAFWPISKVFEYRINGTVQEPNLEPVYFVPRIMRLPVDILREMRERPVPPNSSSPTNSLNSP